MGIGRFVFLVGLGLGLIAFMFWLGHRDLILTFDHQTTTGWITQVHQPPPGFVRASDYEVQYEFADERGMVYSGEDLLPPAKPPPDDGRITVAYSRRDPSVSQIGSQVSATPLSGVLFGAGLVWSALRFARARRLATNRESNA